MTVVTVEPAKARTLDEIEYDCRVRMAEIAALAPAAARGSLDARRARRVKFRELDTALDIYNLTKALEA